MSTYLMRRRKLGHASVRGISHFSEKGIGFFRNDAPVPANADKIIRWGCTSLVPQGMPTFNKAEAIHLANNKSGFRRVVQENLANVVPTTFFRIPEAQDATRDGNSLVVRPQRHAQGRRLFLCTNPAQLRDAAVRCGEGFYASVYIPKVSEYRVYVVQNRVATIARKTPANPQAVAWNVAQGGRFDVCNWGDWPLEGCRKAIQAFALSGLDFGGVDIMADADGNFYVIEINSAPSLPNLDNGDFSYRQKCLAKTFDYMIDNPAFDVPVRYGNWRDVIHPAISEEANV